MPISSVHKSYSHLKQLLSTTNNLMEFKTPRKAGWNGGGVDRKPIVDFNAI